MTTDNSWQRNREGLGVWDGKGKTAFVGWGMSPVDRRWDGVSMDQTRIPVARSACTAAPPREGTCETWSL